MRSLWAGVSGLQAHQIAMDIEGNNIANVNTTGFKYSRANFSDLLSQTAKIATAPQGELGGKNSMQIGLGTQIASVTKIFKQGSIQTTDKNTDLAIQGDGFFVVSPDGGNTYKYSRNGDFSFDAEGNFVEGNGYIIQGWMRDKTTAQIDATAPIGNITIPPGLTTPANDTGFITLKANLASGNSVGTSKSPIYTLDTNSGWVDVDGDGIQSSNEVHVENDAGQNIFNTDKKLYERGQDFGALFNASGEAFNLTDRQGVWISYAEARTVALPVTTTLGVIDFTLNGQQITGTNTSTTNDGSASYLAGLINAKSSLTGIEAQITGGNQIYLINNNKTGTEAGTKNIKITTSATDTTGLSTGAAGAGSLDVLTAYQYTYSSSPLNVSNAYDDGVERTFTTTEDLRAAIQTDARSKVDYLHDGGVTGDKNDGVTVIVNAQGQFEISNPAGDAFNNNDGDYTITASIPQPLTVSAEDILLPSSPIALAAAITPISDITVTTSLGVRVYGPTGADGLTIPAGTILSDPVTIPSGSTFAAGTVYPIGTNFKNPNDYDLYISISSLTNAANNIGTNDKFMTSIAALQGTLTSGSGIRTSQGVYAASHASSIDVYDSLGSKHTVRFEFSKTGYTTDGGTEWSILVSVPEPGNINLGSYPENIVTGTISFKSDGSLATFSPTNITYTANNGSTPNQNIELSFGTLGQFDGMTSFDAASNTSGISQDGYPGGDLAGIRVDETGTLIGSFTNGRSFGLAQVGMAKFTNNEGLESDGGNTFIQTSNSGDPIIGQAAVGGRGFIQASSLEMSNVDLSRSLTQLIVIQRGYQANSKTITTADQLLQTLLQLKQ